MKRRVLAVAFSVLGGLAASCSDRDRSSSSPVEPVVAAKPLARVGVASPQYAWRGLARGGLEARGHNYRVRLDAGVLRFSGPAGASASGEASSFELRSIARGSKAELTAAEPVARGNLLTLNRGVAEERLEVRADGLEQSWVFPRPPAGQGDVTLRLRTEGMSLGSVDARGLHFVAGNRILTYGHATWVDANHEAASLSARYERGDIVLTVPSRLVDSAAYPAVLDPVVSSQLIIVPPTRVPGGAAGNAAVACGSSQCLLVWAQAGFLVARRTQLTGELLDDKVILVGNPTQPSLAVSAAPAGGYLVTYIASTGEAHGVVGAMVGEDGSVSHLPGFVIDDGVDWSVPEATNPVIESAAFADGTHVVMYRQGGGGDHSGRYAARVVGGVVQGEGGVKVGESSDGTVHSLSAGSENVLHVAGNRVSRIAAASGSVLDEPALVLSPKAYGVFAGSSASTFDGTNHVVVWGNADTGELYAARLRDADGQQLDPDVGNSPGARLLCKAAGAIVAPHAAVADGRLYVTWQHNGALVAASFALDPWTSSSGNCNAASVGSMADASDQFVALAGGRGVGIVQKPDELRSFGFDLTSLGAPSVSNDQVLNYHSSAPSLEHGSVKSNGRDFLVVHPDGLERIDGATGDRLGPTVALPHDDSLPPRVLPNGRDYLTRVTNYEFTEGLFLRFYNVRVRCDGAIGRRIRARGVPVVCDGERCLSRYSDSSDDEWVLRVDRDGQQLEDARLLHAGTGDESISYTATTAPPADARQFLAVVSSGQGLGVYKISGTTGVVSAPVSLTQTQVSVRAVASDGSYMTVLWGGSNDYTGLVFNPADDSILVQPKPVPGAIRLDSQFMFDGTSYVAFEWYPKAIVHWLNPALTPVAAANTDISPVPASAQLHASNGYGRTLAVERLTLPEHLGPMIVGHFVDNDLSGSDPNLAPPSCDVSGEGDIGGNGGSSAQGGSAGNAAQGGSPGAGTGGQSDNAGTGGQPSNAGTGGQPSNAGTGGQSDNAGTGGQSDNAGSGGQSSNAGSGGQSGNADSGGQSGNADSGGQSTAAAGEGAESGKGGADHGSGTDRSTVDSCSCRVVGAPGTSSPWHLLAGLLLLSRRRRTTGCSG
jgi:hypothetical protein